MYFTLNALFYTDTLISSRYKGELSFIQDILRSIYSCLVSTVIFTILSFATSFTPILDMLIIEVRLTTNVYVLIKRKIIFFYIVELLFIYNISCFCIIYHSTQVSWFVGGVISLCLSLAVCIGLCIGMALLKYIGLRCAHPTIYNISLFINYYC